MLLVTGWFPWSLVKLATFRLSPCALGPAGSGREVTVSGDSSTRECSPREEEGAVLCPIPGTPWKLYELPVCLDVPVWVGSLPFEVRWGLF